MPKLIMLGRVVKHHSPAYLTDESAVTSMADVLRSSGDDPLTGELGVLNRPDGGRSSEISITVTDERLNQGRPTNIPTLVHGQRSVDSLLAGHRVTAEQEDIAIRRAQQRSYGRPLPAYGSIEDAERAAVARSQAGASLRKYGRR